MTQPMDTQNKIQYAEVSCVANSAGDYYIFKTYYCGEKIPQLLRVIGGIIFIEVQNRRFGFASAVCQHVSGKN